MYEVIRGSDADSGVLGAKGRKRTLSLFSRLPIRKATYHDKLIYSANIPLEAYDKGSMALSYQPVTKFFAT
jgi:hypothetical protein